MFLKSIGVSALGLILLSGCAATAPKSVALSSSKSEAAIIYGQGGGVGGFLKEVFVPIGTKKDIELTNVDGGSVETAPEGNGREYWVSPGERTLSIS